MKAARSVYEYTPQSLYRYVFFCRNKNEILRPVK